MTTCPECRRLRKELGDAQSEAAMRERIASALRDLLADREAQLVLTTRALDAVREALACTS